MKHYFVLGAAALLVLGAMMPVMASYSGRLTESEVKYYMKKYERTCNRHNASLISAMLSKDALIKMTTNGKTYDMNRAHYIRLLTSNFQDVTAYQYRSYIDSVDINGNKAFVRATIYEKTDGTNGTIEKAIKEIAVVEKRPSRSGYALVTTLLADTIQVGSTSAPPVDPAAPPMDPNALPPGDSAPQAPPGVPAAG